ncbi:MAG: hypothetical protein K9K64_06175 [Desulfohalobiaceae bacterium]|nr:hypothetical protein [Desulfohalobiaceae bacterium]
MTEVTRISPEEAREHAQSGQAWLVCAYDEEKCRSMMLQGAMTYSEFKQELQNISPDQEIIFYCA